MLSDGPLSPRPTGSTRLAAVIGWPVRHSLSPVIYNAAFASAGVDWTYVALPVEPGKGAAALDSMRTFGLAGLSVTMPHKSDIAAAVDVPSASVTTLGACNCVYWSDGVLHGDNTDGDGLVAALETETDVSLNGKTVSVLGTGGAARAIIEAIGRTGAASIHVWGRRAEAAEAAAALAPIATTGPLEQVEDADVLINATPVGMSGGPNPKGIPLPADLISQHQIVQDIVYEPRETPFMALARERGARVVGGVGMLVHQAARQYTHWVGEPAPIEVMMRAVQDGE
ncbi:MAG: shikimate dehydrogenase [Acidimicrobiales bacterium]|nr:shikimate dehydrogenase [Acidimicrobiales bacterium]